MLVFRPFVGEILAGKVSCCNKQGIKVGRARLAETSMVALWTDRCSWICREMLL